MEKNKDDILENVKKYKKLSYNSLSKEKFETKSYLKEMSTLDARLKFSLRSRMTKTVQTNFKGDPIFTKKQVVMCRLWESRYTGTYHGLPEVQ